MVWVGSSVSYATAEQAMRELGGLSISARRIRRVVQQIGSERVAERDAAVERFKKMDLPRQQAGSKAVEPPQIGVVMMDGGRYQRRDHFGDKNRPPEANHWKEDKVGCLLSMTGCLHQGDPAPEMPDWLTSSSAVAELAKTAEKQGFPGLRPMPRIVTRKCRKPWATNHRSWFLARCSPAVTMRNRSVGSWRRLPGNAAFRQPHVWRSWPMVPM